MGSASFHQKQKGDVVSLKLNTAFVRDIVGSGSGCEQNSITRRRRRMGRMWRKRRIRTGRRRGGRGGGRGGERERGEEDEKEVEEEENKELNEEEKEEEEEEEKEKEESKRRMRTTSSRNGFLTVVTCDLNTHSFSNYRVLTYCVNQIINDVLRQQSASQCVDISIFICNRLIFLTSKYVCFIASKMRGKLLSHHHPQP